jgi:hypothetical protein
MVHWAFSAFLIILIMGEDMVVSKLLTKYQKERFQNIRWLISTRGHRIGRSFMLACAFVQESLDSGVVRIWDHKIHADILKEIQKVIDMLNATSNKVHYDIKYNMTNRSILVKRIAK